MNITVAENFPPALPASSHNSQPSLCLVDSIKDSFICLINLTSRCIGILIEFIIRQSKLFVKMHIII